MDSSQKSSNFLRILSPVTMVIGLIFRGLLTWKETATVAAENKTRFERLCDRFRIETVRRMKQHEYGLRGSASL